MKRKAVKLLRENIGKSVCPWVCDELVNSTTAVQSIHERKIKIDVRLYLKRKLGL